jgi:hypothetical protein
MPDNLDPNAGVEDEPLPVGDDRDDDDLDDEDDDDPVITPPVAADEPIVEPEPLPAFAYTPAVPNATYTPEERAWLIECEESTDSDVRMRGQDYRTAKVQKAVALTNRVVERHASAIPTTARTQYALAIEEYLGQVPPERATDPNVAIEAVGVAFYHRAMQIGVGPAAAEIAGHYGSALVSQREPAVRKNAPAPMPPSARQPSSSVPQTAPTIAPVRNKSQSEQDAEMAMRLFGMDRGEARRVVAESRRG